MYALKLQVCYVGTGDSNNRSLDEILCQTNLMLRYWYFGIET